MQNIWNEGMRLASQALQFLWHLIELVFHWTFGQVVDMLQLPFMTMIWWKQVLFVLSILAIAYIIYRVAARLWEALGKVGRAIVDLFVVAFVNAPSVLIAGVIAIAFAWVVNNIGAVPWLDNFKFH